MARKKVKRSYRKSANGTFRERIKALVVKETQRAFKKLMKGL